MKTIAWQQFFAGQRDNHGKVIFSASELANVAGTTLHIVNTELGRLVRRGVVARYAQGRYGPPQGVEPEDVVGAIDPGAYITGFYVLFRDHLVTQVPTEITCFTNRRHNRQADRATPAGRLRFMHVPPSIYRKPAGTVSSEQALCDFFWLTLRSGIDPQSLATLRNLGTLKRGKLRLHLGNYPEEVSRAITKALLSGASA